MFGKKKKQSKAKNPKRKNNSAKRKKQLKQLGQTIGVIGWEIYKAKKNVK